MSVPRISLSGNAPTVVESNKADDIAKEMADGDAALAAWREEKESFYRNELQLGDDEVQQLDDLTQTYGDKINEAIAQNDPAPGPDDGNVLIAQIKEITAAYGIEVKAIFGETRYLRAVAFQQAFNQTSGERFGSRLKMTGF